jgi:hypothetical protein
MKINISFHAIIFHYYLDFSIYFVTTLKQGNVTLTHFKFLTNITSNKIYTPTRDPNIILQTHQTSHVYNFMYNY